jgi:Restriction endonuclease BglII
MDIQFADFNVTKETFAGDRGKLWTEMESTLRAMPLHLKASDQEGIQGSFIFDPVGTNEHICASLVAKHWSANVRIPSEFEFLGKDVDFVKKGILAEVQFSNYPFLLNNLLRAELLVNSKTTMDGAPVGAVIIITKAKLFPSSNSTLYYEQGLKQIQALSGNKVFAMPMRLVGLFSPVGSDIDAIWTEYHAPRYSRTITNRQRVRVRIERRLGPRGRHQVQRVP